MNEQELYARWLRVGTTFGFAVLFLSFAAYVLGLLEPLVPPHELTRLWGLPAERYVEAVRGPTGWGWLGYLDKGDYLNLLGVALLALVTAVCYARIIPALPRVHAVLAAIQIAVLLAAALL